jgi:hypothetical protein
MAMLNNQRVVGKMMRNWSTDQILGAPHFYIHKSQKSLLKDQRSAGIALDHGFQALQRWTHSLRYVTRDAVVICFKGSLQLFVTILMLDDVNVRWCEMIGLFKYNYNVYLVGGFNLPLWKIWVRQLGWLFPIYYGK